MLSKLDNTFLPRCNSLLNSCSHCLQWFPSPQKYSQTIFQLMMGPDALVFIFRMLSCRPIFSLSSFTFIKRLFSSSLSAIRFVSSAYLRLLIFLQVIWIPAFAFCSPLFLVMYSEYKLNKHSDHIHPWCPPFNIWNQCVVPCPVLTVASWPA